MILRTALGALAIGGSLVGVWQTEIVSMPSSSMEPSLRKGASVMLAALGPSTVPSRGSIVAFELSGRGQTYLKRVVAVEGDVIEIRNKQVFLNDERLSEPYAVFRDDVVYTRDDDAEEFLIERDQFERTVIPDGHVFVLGDNRDYSFDSRSFGSVPVDAITGVVRQ